MSICNKCYEYFISSSNGHDYCAECSHDNLKDNFAALRADRDELRATLSGLCSFLGAGVPGARTTAAEMNRMIHEGINRREEAARQEASKERDELRRVLEQCLKYGRMPYGIANQAHKLLEAKA